MHTGDLLDIQDLKGQQFEIQCHLAIILEPRCPADHPYAYKNGKQCCKTTQEFTNGRGASKAEKESGTCDGIGFNRDSTCCKDYERVPCPQKNECFNHDDIGMMNL